MAIKCRSWLSQITTEITAAAAIDLVSKLDPTGGFGAFHGSWFANRANKVGV
jgi:hypothetical protein